MMNSKQTAMLFLENRVFFLCSHVRCSVFLFGLVNINIRQSEKRKYKMNIKMFKIMNHLGLVCDWTFSGKGNFSLDFFFPRL